MLRYGIILCMVVPSFFAYGQSTDLKAITPDSTSFENIHVKKISEDSLHSTYIIWVKKNVDSHFHSFHTEQVIVLEGSGIMTLGDSTFNINIGDFIVIPAGTVHSVKTTSTEALKVISIQSPRFVSDRIWVKP